MQRSEVLSTARLAGEVVRYHTWPMHRRQSVGEHTWQLCRLWWQIFGPLAPEVSTYLIWHDAGELVTGDPPFPVKARNPDLKAVMDRLEGDAVAAMGGPAAARLSARDRVRAKIVDLLDMWECGRMELVMGNTFAQPIVDDTRAAVNKLVVELPKEDRARVEAYVATVGAQ
jgi:5'-deoxynucleotidase YfbR-like